MTMPASTSVLDCSSAAATRPTGLDCGLAVGSGLARHVGNRNLLRLGWGRGNCRDQGAHRGDHGDRDRRSHGVVDGEHIGVAVGAQRHVLPDAVDDHRNDGVNRKLLDLRVLPRFEWGIYNAADLDLDLRNRRIPNNQLCHACLDRRHFDRVRVGVATAFTVSRDVRFGPNQR